MTSADPTPDSVYSAIAGLQRLAEVFERRRVQLAQSAGLSDGQWRVLEEIATEHFMPSLFARRREIHPASLSRTLRQLQEKGLIEVAISDADGRQRNYALSAAGRRALERLRGEREAAIDRVWRPLPERELEGFAAFSHELADRLEAYAADRSED